MAAEPLVSYEFAYKLFRQKDRRPEEEYPEEYPIEERLLVTRFGMPVAM